MNLDPENPSASKPSPPAHGGISSTATSGVSDLSVDDPGEHLEPGEAQRPVPLLFITFACAFFAWGGYYMQRYSGGYTPLSYDENSFGGPPKTNTVQVVDPYALGKRLFGDTCAKCHQADGQGLPGQYPPLVKSEWVLASGPARMIRITLDGLQGPIRVKGLDYNNNMTPWRDTLSDQQLAAIITFVRTQKEWGHTATPVTPEEVADIRKKTKDRPLIGPWTAKELENIPEHEPTP